MNFKIFLLLLVTLIFCDNLFSKEKYKLFQTKNNKVSIKYHNLSKNDFLKIKKNVGTFDINKIYNTNTKGFPTGFIPPSEEQWNKIENELNLTLEIETYLETIPASVDWSTSKYFPPIGRQLVGSCVSWALGYYAKTFYEAKDKDWDLSGANWINNEPSSFYQNKIASPTFIYNQTNHGRNNGSNAFDALKLLCNIGVCSWEKMKCDENDPTYWPSEAAWREAPLWRCEEYFSSWVQDEDGITDMKELLSSGILLSFPANSDHLFGTTTLDNYPSGLNKDHFVTIVGYDDNKSYTEEGAIKYGAFKVVNSWGPSWGDNNDGCFYISYNLLKDRLHFIYYFLDKIDYDPEIIACFQIDHSIRDECYITFGYGDASNPDITKEFFKVSEFDNNPFPNNKIILDLTEFSESVQNKSKDFYMNIDDIGTITNGNCQHFSIECYNQYNNPPVHLLNSEDIPIQTRHFPSIYLYVKPLQLKFPNGNNHFNVGDNCMIEWDFLNVNEVKLQYSIDLCNWRDMTTLDASKKRYNWTIPIESSPVCKVKVIDTNNSNTFDLSNNFFKITGDKLIDIIFPNGDEILSVNDVQTIKWQRQNYNEPVNVILYKSFVPIDTIASNIIVDSLDWNPNYTMNGDDYRIGICGLNSFPFEISENDFTISSPLDLITPNGGEEWLKGSTKTITWNKGNYDGLVDIKLLCNKKEVTLIATSVSDTLYHWLIPNYLDNSENYSIKVESNQYKFGDESDQFFIISNIVKSWSHAIGDEIYSTPALNDSVLYFTTHSSKLVAVSKRGNILWNFNGGCFSYNSPAIDQNGNIYYGTNKISSDYDNFYSIDKTGLKVWSKHIGSSSNGFGKNSVSIIDELLFAARPYDDYLTCFLYDGTIYWKYDLPSGPPTAGITTPVIGHDGTIYICDRSGKILAINPDGSLKWETPIIVESYGPVLDCNGNIYTSGWNGFTALNSQGDILWTKFFRSKQIPIIGSDGIIYVVDNPNNCLMALDRNGQEKWSYNQASDICGTPTIGASNTIYFVDKRQCINAVNNEGVKKWEYYIGPTNFDRSYNGSAPILDNNYIYIASKSDIVYAFQTNYETGLADSPWPKEHKNLKNTSFATEYINLIYPNGEEILKAGETVEIKWQKSSNIDAIAINYSLDNGVNWHLITELTNNDSTYHWRIPDFSETQIECKIKINVDKRDAFYDESQNVFTIEDNAEKIVYRFNKSGWQLISLPVTVENDSVGKLFSSVIEAFSWDENEQTYYLTEILTPETGYWLNISNPGTDAIKGMPVENFSKHCTKGWNLIGSIFDTVEVSSIMTEPAGSILAAFYWDSDQKKYLTTNKIFPQNGYWFAISKDCELNINSSALNSRIIKPKLAKLTESFINSYGAYPPPPPDQFISSVTDKIIPTKYKLYQNYPNPFNPNTEIRFDLPEKSNIEIKIYNITGQMVRTIISKNIVAGQHSIIWNGKNDDGLELSSGLYIYSIKTEKYFKSSKMIKLK